MMWPANRTKSLWLLLAACLLCCLLWDCRQAPQEESPPTYGHLKSLASPAWARQTILYEVYVRAFSEEGTLAKVTERLPELNELGVETIWLMPIHPIGKEGRKGALGCPYSVRDYLTVNPEYGSESDFRQLVERAHGLGLKVILDWVANHSANDHVEMEHHPDWFARDKEGRFTREVADWWDVTDFNYDHPGMRAYMKGALLHWVQAFDVDGYRCDVAGMVPGEFWVDVRSGLQRAKPDVFLLAEWEDPKMHLQQFDATYDWGLYHTLKAIRLGEKKAEEAIDLVLAKKAEYPAGALRMRFIENHDEQRAAKVFGLPGYQPFATFIFTQEGLPLLYAGQEAADTVKPGLFDKVEVSWDGGNPAVRSFYQGLIRMRKGHPVFIEGETVKIATDQPSAIVAYARLTADEMAIVALNFSAAAVTATLSFPDEVRRGREHRLFNKEKDEPVQLLSEATTQMHFEPFESVVYLSQ